MMPSWKYFWLDISIFLFFPFEIAGLRTECDLYISPSLPTSFQVEEEFVKNGNISKDGKSMSCYHEYSQCMVLWTFDQYDSNVTTVLLKGCWKGNGDCEREECVAHEDINPKFLNNSRFCCCSSSRCNSNFTFVWMPKNHTRFGISNVPPRHTSGNSTTIIFISSAAVVILLLFALGGFCVYSSSQKRRRLDSEKLNLTSSHGDTDREKLLSPDYLPFKQKLVLDADQIQLLEIISRGRFSTVYKSIYKLTDDHVAVKIYTPAHRPYYCNENKIYSWLNYFEHENIIRFYGAAEVERNVFNPGNDELIRSASLPNQTLTSSPLLQQYWIVTAYMPQGTLQEYLKANTVDWEEMCKMGASLACGLAYLHGAVNVNGCVKPPIVHRDVNSRNTLVKADGTCAICDFGFALALEEPKAGAPNSHSDTPLTEVGTIRYFAPEILEGAVNLRDPGTSLKQVDVYAMGLVLWEIISRCAPIYYLSVTERELDQPIPDYQLPYANDIGARPTLEQMQLWVCKKKVRPLFQNAFYKFNNIGALRVLRILVEDCWDSDSEARITASCAHERLIGLQNLVNVTATKDGDGVFKPASHGGNLDFSSPYSRYFSISDYNRPLQYSSGDSTADTLATGATSGVGSMCLNSSDRNRSVNSASLGYHTTAESLVTLQPFQGKNPCLERNTLHESSDDSANGKNRLTESRFQKIDPCSPDGFARFATPALLALATQNGNGKASDADENAATGTTSECNSLAAEKGNILAMLLMKSEKNRNARMDSSKRLNITQAETEFTKPTSHQSGSVVEQQPQTAARLSNPAVVIDFRGSVSGTSNDSGNCTTMSSSGSGNNSASGSPRFREADQQHEHRLTA